MPEAIYAEGHQADQIELCSDLEHDGLSPSFELIEKILSKINLPVKVMVRCRPGDFFYTPSELKNMIDYVDKIRQYPLQGIVFGALKEDYSLNLKAIQSVAAVSDFPITIHKCIDLVNDPFLEMKRLESVSKVQFILSSGKAPNALEGIPLLKKMIDLGGDRLSVIVAGSVSSINLAYLHSKINASYYHGRKIV